MCFAIITYLNVVRKCDCSCTDQDHQYEVERDGDGVWKQEQRFFHPPSCPSSPPILFLCLLLVLFVLLLFLSFIFSYFSSSFLPFFSFSSFSYVCFNHPSLNSLFYFLFKLFFLHNHHPILFFLTPQSRLTRYIIWLSVVGFCHDSLCICPTGAPYSCPLPAQSQIPRTVRNTHL